MPMDFQTRYWVCELLFLFGFKDFLCAQRQKGLYWYPNGVPYAIGPTEFVNFCFQRLSLRSMTKFVLICHRSSLRDTEFVNCCFGRRPVCSKTEKVPVLQAYWYANGGHTRPWVCELLFLETSFVLNDKVCTDRQRTSIHGTEFVNFCFGRSSVSSVTRRARLVGLLICQRDTEFVNICF